MKDFEAEVEKKTLDIVDLVYRLRSSMKQLDGVSSQNKALSQLKPDKRTAIAIAEEQGGGFSKMETNNTMIRSEERRVVVSPTTR